jgi:hypothetical protein
MWTQPLVHSNDSCYMDSAMIALFLRPCRAVKNAIEKKKCSSPDFTKICGERKSARNVQRVIRNTAIELSEHSPSSMDSVDLSFLRVSAKSCPALNGRERFDREGMNDPSVFLEYIFAIFPCLNMTVRKVSECSDCNAIVSLDEKTTPLVYLETGPLKSIDGLMLSNVIEIHEENSGIEFRSPGFIVFDLTRLDMRGRYLKNVQVIPDQSIRLGGGRLQLRAVVVWHNFHYTVYAKVGRTWYYFDDMEDEVEKIGTYKDMIEDDDEFATMDGKLFVYGR